MVVPAAWSALHPGPLPGWMRSYRRAWLRPDLIAGVVIWSVVTPQAVAYAQIAGLRPEAGLMAAPVAMLAYALVGTSRQLVVSATTATSAVSAATVGPLADGDPVRFAALSAALALVVAVVLVLGGAAAPRRGLRPRLQAGDDRLPVRPRDDDHARAAAEPARRRAGEGNFFPALWDLLGELGDGPWRHARRRRRLARGPDRRRPAAARVPSTLLVLVLAIAVSALAGCSATASTSSATSRTRCRIRRSPTSRPPTSST